MRLQWLQCVLVEPSIKCLFKDDGNVGEIEVRLLVYGLRVENCCWYEAWVLRCRMLAGTDIYNGEALYVPTKRSLNVVPFRTA
jgi:hypothetical protein